MSPPTRALSRFSYLRSYKSDGDATTAGAACEPLRDASVCALAVPAPGAEAFVGVLMSTDSSSYTSMVSMTVPFAATRWMTTVGVRSVASFDSESEGVSAGVSPPRNRVIASVSANDLTSPERASTNAT